jgi:hypothetical protein
VLLCAVVAGTALGAIGLPAVVGATAAQAATTTFYVDAVNGSDTSVGTTPDTAWRSLAKATSATLQPGSALLLRRGQSWTGRLRIDESGTATAPVEVGAYGAGELPRIVGSVEAYGSYVQISSVHADGASWAGAVLGGSHGVLRDSLLTNSVTGVHVRSGATDNKVLDNVVRDNNRMSVNTSTPTDDDSGAFGILLNGSRTEVAGNRISGHDAASYDYGRDGAAVEVYGGTDNSIHHNVALDNHTFSELGNPSTTRTTYAYNLVASSLPGSNGLITRGSTSSWGPVTETVMHNNTFVFTGTSSQGFVCHGGCGPTILRMRNNVVQAVWKVGYADAAFDEASNLYYGGQIQFTRSSSSVVADPQFVDLGGRDFHLKATSPAVDRGVATSWTTDLDGGAVPQDGDRNGSAAADLGAYELAGAAPAPTSPSPSAPAAGLSDGFETCDLSRWSNVLVTTGGGVGITRSTVRSGSCAAQFTSTGADGTAALRHQLPAATTAVAVDAAVDVVAEGASGGNVPLVRLLATDGTRVLSVYRQNRDSDRVYVQVGSGGTRYIATGGKLRVGTWGAVSVRVAGGNVEVLLNGRSIYSGPAPCA